MVVGVLELTLQIVEADSLKAKRSVVKSLVERTQNRFAVAAAEVGDNDAHQRAMLGFSTVGNDGALVNSVLDQVVRFVEDQAIGRARIAGHRMELIRF